MGQGEKKTRGLRSAASCYAFEKNRERCENGRLKHTESFEERCRRDGALSGTQRLRGLRRGGCCGSFGRGGTVNRGENQTSSSSRYPRTPTFRGAVRSGCSKGAEGAAYHDRSSRAAEDRQTVRTYRPHRESNAQKGRNGRAGLGKKWAGHTHRQGKIVYGCPRQGN